MLEFGGIYFSFLDGAVAVFLLLGLITGLRRKLSGEFALLLIAAATLLAGVQIHRAVAEMLVAHTRLQDHPEAAKAAAFLLVVVTAGCALFLLRLTLGLVMKITFNEKIDRIAGGVAGALRSALIAAIVIIAAGLWPNPFLRAAIREESLFGKTIFKYLPGLTEKIGELMEPVMPPAARERAEPPKEEHK